MLDFVSVSPQDRSRKPSTGSQEDVVCIGPNVWSWRIIIRSPGRAYSEDLFHSAILSDRGVTMKFVDEATVTMPFNKLTLMEGIKEQAFSLRATLKFIRTRKLSITRYCCAMFILLSGHACRRMFGR